MRYLIIAVVTLGLLIPAHGRAQSVSPSSLRLAHPSVMVGQPELLVVYARDLDGHPLTNAVVVAEVHMGNMTRTYQARPTNGAGQTQITIIPPRSVTSHLATVSVIINNGYLAIHLTARFRVGSASAAPKSTRSLAVTAQVLPSVVTAPAPAWLVVSVRGSGAKDVQGAKVSAIAGFASPPAQFSGVTDANGVATIRIDTAGAAGGTQKIQIVARWKSQQGHASTQLLVRRPTATAIPMPTQRPTPVPPLPTLAPLPAPTVAPTATSAPTVTPTPYPNATNTPVPTSTPYPTATQAPTSTLVPTITNTPAPTSTLAPVAPCPGTYNGHDGCIDVMYSMINQVRGQNGLGAYTLDMTQSLGTSTCAGSYGHSTAMEQSGQVWHDNSNYPAQSWPNNVCVNFFAAAENVGQWSSGNEVQDLQNILNVMMNEAHDPQTCAIGDNHACNILSKHYSRVGIGIYNHAGTTWLTEDFVG